MDGVSVSSFRVVTRFPAINRTDRIGHIIDRFAVIRWMLHLFSCIYNIREISKECEKKHLSRNEKSLLSGIVLLDIALKDGKQMENYMCFYPWFIITRQLAGDTTDANSSPFHPPFFFIASRFLSFFCIFPKGVLSLSLFFIVFSITVTGRPTFASHPRIQEEDWKKRKVVHRDGRAVKFRVETGNIKRRSSFFEKIGMAFSGGEE